MSKIAFRNQNGLRNSKRTLKNGLSPRVTAQVAALNGATVYGNGKLRNSSGPDTAPEVKQPPVENPPAEPKVATEAEQEAANKKANEQTAIANAKKPLPDFIQKQIDAKKGKDGDADDAPKKKVKNSTSVYPSVRGNYQSALSAMRVKLANSDMGDELMNDCDDDDDANEEAGEDNIPASEIIYGDDGEILNQDPNNLVVTTQAPAVQ